ncbi:MAG: peptidase S10 [Vicinamibacteria bacterium]|nr:peptidase S10 [Vicinamibacteria bacterium]
MRHVTKTLGTLALWLGAWTLAADEVKKVDPQPSPIPAPASFVSRHSGRFGGETVAYTATADELYLKDDAGEPKAAIFSFAYVKDGVTDPAARPVTFVWNGGPGSSSIWLHFGGLGPKRARVPSDAKDDGPPPYTLADNPESPLDQTDLVFVDPVGTGWSRPLGKHEGKEFWGLAEDAEAMAEFVRDWLTKHKRWASPKYLLGESFGTTRAAAVASRLEGGRHGVSLNGVILVSQALDYGGSTSVPGNVQSFVTYLPTMAATAHFHGRARNAPKELSTFLDAVRQFAVDEYAPALIKGTALPPDERTALARRLADMLGLSEEYVLRADLQVTADRFRKELLRDRGLSVGRLDGRYTGDDGDDVAEQPSGDPSSWGIDGAFVASFHDHAQRGLGIALDRPYKVSGGRELSGAWKWRTAPEGTHWEPSWVDTTRDLAQAMRRNPGLRVLVASGYYDFATPFFDAELTFARPVFPTGGSRQAKPGARALGGSGANGRSSAPEPPSGRVEFSYYEAGHMMYVHQPSHEALAGDLRRFLRGR